MQSDGRASSASFLGHILKMNHWLAQPPLIIRFLCFTFSSAVELVYPEPSIYPTNPGPSSEIVLTEAGHMLSRVRHSLLSSLVIFLTLGFWYTCPLPGSLLLLAPVSHSSDYWVPTFSLCHVHPLHPCAISSLLRMSALVPVNLLSACQAFSQEPEHRLCFQDREHRLCFALDRCYRVPLESFSTLDL